MATLVTEKLAGVVGAEVVGVDVDRLLTDEELPRATMAALEQNGVLLFRELNADDAAQIAFCRTLGELIKFPGRTPPEIMEVSFRPENPNAEYLRSNDLWHMDGALDDGYPPKATALSARVVAPRGGETEFASAYAAYDMLCADERERCEKLRVVHTFEAVQRLSYPDPTPEQLGQWRARTPREHPLVWHHRSGRGSLVFGATTSHVVGMDPAAGRALLDDLLARATAPERVLRHSWSVGDLVIWDNGGMIHRACEFDRTLPRLMHRSTLAGEEAIQ